MEVEFFGGPQDGLKLDVPKLDTYYKFPVLDLPVEQWDAALATRAAYARVVIKHAVYKLIHGTYVYAGEE